MTGRTTDARSRDLRARASEVSDRLPGAHRLRIASFDALTGNPAVVVSEGAPAERGNYVQRALVHLREVDQALGLTATQPAEFVADPDVQTTSSGAVAVHVRQQYKGVDIFQAAKTVRFAPDGRVKETAGSLCDVPHDLEPVPRLSVEEAVAAAARHVATPDEDEHEKTDAFGNPLPAAGVDLAGFEPKTVAVFSDKADLPTVLEPGPFGASITANLVWFPLDELRLGWEVVLTMPDSAGQYRLVVDADDGKILYCGQLMLHVAAQGNVFRVDGSEPRAMTSFPLDLTEYGLPLPAGLPAEFPDDWVDADSTVGNSVDAHLGETGPPLRGVTSNGKVTFDPSDPFGDDQKVLNIFYYNCYMHDFFYLLGFTELAGNFQADVFGRGGRGHDPVDARSHPGAVFGTANMLTPIDGLQPEMNMGLVTSTNRHTAFDSTVVFHEFMHGVTNRLVGGPLDDRALEAPQSGGMGEGWGDYVACTINDDEVVGAWVVDNPGGIRGFPYNSDFPDDFGDLGKGRYREVHNIGEIWCATLLEMNRKISKVLGVQLVVDALMLAPTQPSFLDMRDAILAALDAKRDAGQLDGGDHATARRGIWEVFARFGMGPDARSNGSRLTGIVADFNVPDEEGGTVVTAESTPNLAIPDNDPGGVRDTLTIAGQGSIARITVAVDIRHTFIGDLRVTLTSPAGTAAILHDRAGGSANDLVASFSSDDTTALAALVGEAAAGESELHVADLAGLDRGKLRRWSLAIELA